MNPKFFAATARTLEPPIVKHTGFLDDEKGGSLDGRAPRRVLQGSSRHGLDVDPEPLVLRQPLPEPPEQLRLARELEELLDVLALLQQRVEDDLGRIPE